MNKEHKLNALTVAFMYVGTIMGAGFASGREIWQFFGVFVSKAYVGIIFVGVLFVSIGIMTGIIARKLGTNHIGKIIVPGNNKLAVDFVGYFMAFMLFTVLITMSAAGGALFNQQFGQSRILGGLIIIILVTVTVIGGFHRVSKAFRLIMPVLVVIIVALCIIICTSDLEASKIVIDIKPSPLAKNWYISAILYLSYNILAVIPIVATATYNAKSTKHALLGSGLGGIFLALLAFLLVSAMKTDPGLSQSVDMPMLAFSVKIAPWVNFLYTLVLFFAIYGSATGNYYGFTLRLKDTPNKNKKVIIIAMIGFVLGLVGFKNVVAYMFPLEGFAGISIILMLFINFFRVIKLPNEYRRK